jgi:Xaa-Pro dipeptidase
MAIVEQKVTLSEEMLAEMQRELRGRSMDGWLLYNFQGLNPIASRVLGLPAMTRRYFVLIPAHGRPVALTHRIEQQPWSTWIGENRQFLSWRELEVELGRLLRGLVRVAAEYTPGDAVPYVDRIPAGVVEMIRSASVEPVSSADLVSAFYSRWSDAGLQSHRKAAGIIREIAHAAFQRISESLRSGGEPTEWEIREWIQQEIARRGLGGGSDTIVAVNANAANPHYGPTREEHAVIRRGDLVLIDLWAKENEEAIWADQTWMGYVGDDVPQRLSDIFACVRDARDAAVELVRKRWAENRAVAGYEVDEVARNLVSERGFGDAFIHRTGHSIDRELHGSGPNIDNLETRDTRELIRGIGFSVEPGIYLAGDVGFRTEINVYMGPDGPEVTTPEPQREIIRIHG